MMILEHKFVDVIPDTIPYGYLFISIKYKTAIHLCVCGCGNEVVTPLSPNDWQLTFDGASVSLSPSIGNWNFECRSHYWITKNQVIHSSSLSDKEIKSGRKKDKRKKRSFFSRKRSNK